MSDLSGKAVGLFERFRRVESEVPRVEDPGKDFRSASGLPIVPAFDGFRALAIMGVVVLHLITIQGLASPDGNNLLAVVVWGALGRAVEVLFVVSGFVVFLPTVARSGKFGSIKAYAIRRAARLAPAYWVALILSCLVLFILFPPFAHPTIPQMAVHFLFLQTPMHWIHSSIVPGLAINAPVWTLSIEVTFYVLLPFIATWYARRPFVGLLIALAITVVWQEFLMHYFQKLGDAAGFVVTAPMIFGGTNQFPSWTLSFAVGMTAAWMYVNWVMPGKGIFASPVRTNLLCGLVLTVLVGFAVWAGTEASAIGGLLSYAYQPALLGVGFTLSLGAAMLMISASGRAFQAVFANRPVRKLGDMSYGIYLSHYALISIAIGVLGFEEVDTLEGVLTLSAFVLPTTLLYGYLSARFLEQPIRRWAHRFGARAQGPAKT